MLPVCDTMRNQYRCIEPTILHRLAEGDGRTMQVRTGIRAALIKVTLSASLLVGIPAGAMGQAEYRLRISTENTRAHVQTQAIEHFALELERVTEGRIDVEFYHSAQLFRDRDVIAALSSGKVEMAVPGMWQLDRYVPDVGLYMLPLFYGRTAEENYHVRDGEIGALVSQRIARGLGVAVPGRWLDLGHAHLYFTNADIQAHEDLAGAKIRIPGGIANKKRLQAFGADPVVVAWPDLSDALSRNQITGVLTTHETIRSAKLWRNGISTSFEDMEYFAQYVPMINARFWANLPAPLQQQVRNSWDQIVDAQRYAAIKAQLSARSALMEQGIKVTSPSADTLMRWRKVARQEEPAMVRQMGVDPSLVIRAAAALGE